jgi:hypothetical protein
MFVIESICDNIFKTLDQQNGETELLDDNPWHKPLMMKILTR